MIVRARVLVVFLVNLLSGQALWAQALFLSDVAQQRRDREFAEGWVGYHPSTLSQRFELWAPSLECLAVSNHEHLTYQIRPQTLPRPVQTSTFFSQHLGFSPSAGQSFWCFPRASVRATSWLAIRTSIGGGVRANFRQADYHVEELAAEVRLNKLTVSLGRKPIYWGQSFISPLSLSYNSTPLNSLQLTTEPLELPWFMKTWGSFRTEFFWAPMGGDRLPQNDHLIGLRLGWKPSSRWEANMSLLYQFGGDGPDYEESWKDLFLEFIGARPDTAESISTGSATNRGVAFDLRYRLPTRLPLSIYAENHLEDCCGEITSWNSWKDTLGYRYSYLAGLALGLEDRWKSTFRLEYLRVTNLFNFHGKWPSGFSYRGREVGPYSGRDSRVIALDWQARPNLVWNLLRFAVYAQELAHYKRAHFSLEGTPLEGYDPNYQKAEWRLGAVVESALSDPRFGIQWGLATGFERIWNKSYRQSDDGFGFAGVLRATRQF